MNRCLKAVLILLVGGLLLNPAESMMAEKDISFAISPTYEYAGPFANGIAVVAQDGLLGLINKEGKEIVPPYYNHMVDAEGRAIEIGPYFYNEYWMSTYMTDKAGLVTQERDTGNTTAIFSDGLALVAKDGLYGYINQDGQEVIKTQYVYADPFQQGLALVRTDSGYGYIDTQGNPVIPPIYKGSLLFQDDVVFMHTKDDENILFNRSGEKLAIFHKKLKVDSFKEGLALVYDSSNKQYGYMSKQGKWVIRPIYYQAAPFSEGLALVKQKGKYGFIDMSGKEVIAPQYEQAYSFQNGLAQIIVNHGYGYIDTKGQIVVEPKYDYAFQYEDGMIRVVEDQRMGFLDAKGMLIAEPHYDETDYNDTIPFVNGFRMVSVDGKFGYLDSSGQEIVKPQYDKVAPFFSEGLAAIVSNGRVGYVDETGREVIKPAYDEPPLSLFNEGLAVVMMKHRFGLMNNKKEMALPMSKVFENVLPSTDGMIPVRVDGLWGYIATPTETVNSSNKTIVFVGAGAIAILIPVAWFFLKRSRRD